MLENIDIKYLNNITIEVLNQVSDNTKKSLFKRAVNANSCELVYSLLCDAGINAYNDIINNDNLVTLAIKYNHIKLAELLLQDKTLNIKDDDLYYSYYYGCSEITAFYNIKYILANKARFTKGTLIKHLQAKSQKGCPGLFVALEKGYKKTVTEYIDTILNIDINVVTVEQKVKLLEAKNQSGCLGLFMALQNGHDKTVTEYINAILNSNQFTKEQKIKLLEAQSQTGCPRLFVALLEVGHDKVVKEYIQTILNTDIEGVTIEQKLNLIEAKSKNSFSGLYVALQNGHDKIVTEYFKVIVASKKLAIEQKTILFSEIRNNNLELYAELVNNSYLTVEEKNYLLTVNSGKCTIL